MKATTERGELIGCWLTCFADERILGDRAMLAVFRGIAGVCLCVYLAVLGAGCDNPFKDDGSTVAAAPEPDEYYVSVTNAAGAVTTVPITVDADDGAVVIIGDGNTFTSSPVDNSSQDRITAEPK